MKIIIAVGTALAVIAAFAIYVMMEGTDAPVIGNQPPRAMIDAPSEVILSQPAVFSGEGSYDDDGDELTYFWEFDDGTNTTGPVVEHTYTEYFGNVDDDWHWVNLTVSDGEYEDSVSVTVTVVIPKEEKPPEVILFPSIRSDPIYGITYVVEVKYISEGDANINNITYSIVSAETGDELANGTVQEADESSLDAPVSYLNNWDDYMETYEYFRILSEPLKTGGGDYFYLTHNPTGIKMGECQFPS